MTFHFSPERVRARRIARPRAPALSDRTSLKNCTTCKHLAECDSPRKDYKYLCTKYEPPQVLSGTDYIDMLNFDKVNEEIEKERVAISDIDKMIAQAIADQEQGVQTDFTLEDGDIPTAKNFVDFYTNPDFGWGITPFAKQIEAAIELLTEFCLNPKCSDIEYAKCIPTDATVDQIKEKVTLLEHGVCPKCSQNRFDMWNKYKARRPNTLVLCSGQRSSKDWETGLLSAYQDHRYLKLRKPALTYHHAPGTLFYQTFTGINFGQAKKATFQPYKEFIENSKWYKRYHEMLDHVGQKKGKELYKIGEDSIIWSYHGLATLVSSPDVRALRGVARRGWSITELAYFYTKTKGTVRLDADGIIEALNNSMLGVAGGYERCLEEGKFDVPPPLTFLPSSPRSIRDPIMILLKTANEDPTIVARHYSSFEFNPTLKETDPFVTSLKIRNPAKYRTSILAIPADAASAFIPDKRLILHCIDDDRDNAIKGKNTEVITPTKARMTSGVIRISNKADKESPKVLSIDTSINNNSFAMTLAHLEEWEDRDGLIKEVTVIDGLYEIIPSTNKPCFYADIYENVILPICEELNVVLAITDRYPGSVQLIQTLDRDMEIPGIIRSVKYGDYSLFKQNLYNAAVSIPKMECSADEAKKLSNSGDYPHSFNKRPVAHTLMQAITVEDLMGKKVDKGEGFTDDLIYSLVNAHAVCNDPAYKEELFGEGSTETFTEELVGVKVGYSSGIESIHSVGGSGNSENDIVIGVVSSFRSI